MGKLADPSHAIQNDFNVIRFSQGRFDQPTP
jgi:hypothetical protein